jgi:ketosteroid isomerase-like protein
LAGNCFAADWTPDQSEVLQVVAAYTEASHQRDFNAYLSFWHPEFLGWHNGDDNPTDHEARSNGLKHYFDATKSLNYEFEPIAVQILTDGDAAIVHYKLRNVLEVRETGERIRGISYWTDYLVRDNDRWLLISDHGGGVAEEGKAN